MFPINLLSILKGCKNYSNSQAFYRWTTFPWRTNKMSARFLPIPREIFSNSIRINIFFTTGTDSKSSLLYDNRHLLTAVSSTLYWWARLTWTNNVHRNRIYSPGRAQLRSTDPYSNLNSVYHYYNYYTKFSSKLQIFIGTPGEIRTPNRSLRRRLSSWTEPLGRTSAPNS